jgi:hypothetical protein
MSRFALGATIALCLAIVGVALAQALAQPATIYVVPRSVVGSASADTLEGNSYRLSAIVGQPVVGESNAEDAYSVRHGYPQPFAQGEFEVYLPLILKQ